MRLAAAKENIEKEKRCIFDIGTAKSPSQCLRCTTLWLASLSTTNSRWEKNQTISMPIAVQNVAPAALLTPKNNVIQTYLIEIRFNLPRKKRWSIQYWPCSLMSRYKPTYNARNERWLYGISTCSHRACDSFVCSSIRIIQVPDFY